jgi:hypothetical protein
MLTSFGGIAYLRRTWDWSSYSYTKYPCIHFPKPLARSSDFLLCCREPGKAVTRTYVPIDKTHGEGRSEVLVKMFLLTFMQDAETDADAEGEEMCRSNTNPNRHPVHKLLCAFSGRTYSTVSSISLFNGLTVSRADWKIVAEPHSLSSAIHNETMKYWTSAGVEESHYCASV